MTNDIANRKLLSALGIAASTALAVSLRRSEYVRREFPRL